MSLRAPSLDQCCSHCNDITKDIDSEIRLFADDCLLSRNQRYRGHCEISGGYISSIYRKLPSIYVFSYFPFGFEGRMWDLIVSVPDRCLSFYFGCWARKWGMSFQPVKCNIMQITRKRIKKISASYNLEGIVLDNVENIKYLGGTITNDLKWNTHVSNICTKANRTLGFLRRNLSACPHDVKKSAYKGLVRPVLGYGSSVLDPSSILLQEELEKVQKRATRFVTGNYIYETGSMTCILDN